jgi:CO/xanthine dehydrogenase FAD-binding subunit
VRSWLAQHEMRSAKTLDEALMILAPGDVAPFAGDTDLMVLLEAGKLPKRRFLDVWRVPELRGITATDDETVIGALSTYTDLLESSIVAAAYPLLCAAARETGAVAIQNRGTVGGNIANASPAADLPPALLVYDAELELASVRGTRRVPYHAFHSGYKKMDLAPDELIVSVRLPRPSGAQRQSYRKVGTRRAQAISKICFAGVVEFLPHAGLPPEGGRHTTAMGGGSRTIRQIRIAFGSVAPTVVRARAAEAVLRGRTVDPQTIAEARRALVEDIAPIDDLRSTANYRLTVAGNLLEEFLS